MTHASVFSGIGGPEVAATMLGWENLFHCEINPFGRAVLDYWYPNAKSYEDITTTDFSEWRGKVDVLTGGFPCQPFSYAGQRRGAQDDRYLWPYMFRCIDAIRPRWVVAENVAGILTMVEQGEVSGVETQGSLFDEGDAVRRYRLRETFTLQRICDDLEGHGYAVQPVLIPACAVGAPHRRDRVFIVGRRRDDIVADPDNGADGRAAGADEGEGGAQRLQERHEVREPDEPNQVRPKSEKVQQQNERPATYTAMCGDSGRPGQILREERRPTELDAEPCINGGSDAPPHAVGGGEGTPGEGGGIESDGSHEDKQPRQWGAASEWNSRFYELLRNAADTESEQGGLLRPQQSENCRAEQEQLGREYSQDGCERHPADTEREQLLSSEHVGQSRLGERLSSWCGCRTLREWAIRSEAIGICGERWRDFPTVSPVHRGNDGLPFSLDNLTLSPAKWRTEALKAYGNAIVPQVMYEIFRAIEIAEAEYRKGTAAVGINDYDYDNEKS